MLSSSFSDDWSRNDKETWDKKKLGSCKTKAFDPCKGFDVAIKKKVGKKDSFKVSNLTLELSKADEKTPSAKYISEKNISRASIILSILRYVCPSYVVTGTDTIKRATCSLEPRSSSLQCSRPNSPTAAPRRPTSPTQRTPTNRPPASPTRSV